VRASSRVVPQAPDHGLRILSNVIASVRKAKDADRNGHAQTVVF